jgi:hypothetical protein
VVLTQDEMAAKLRRSGWRVGPPRVRNYIRQQVAAIEIERLREIGPIDPQRCVHNVYNQQRILAQNRLFRAAYEKLRCHHRTSAEYEEVTEALVGRAPPNQHHIETALRVLSGELPRTA